MSEREYRQACDDVSVIPKSFKLMGYTIKVSVCPMPESENGSWSSEEQIIKLAPSMSDQAKLQTFWHEVFHACLEMQSYDDLSKDEAFVDRIGHCLAQIELTRKP